MGSSSSSSSMGFIALQEAYAAINRDIDMRNNTAAVVRNKQDMQRKKDDDDGNERHLPPSARDAVNANANAHHAMAKPAAMAQELKEHANALFAKGDAVGAVRVYADAIAWDPGEPTLFANRCLALMQLGQFELAVADARRAVALRPRWAKAHHRLGQALARTGALTEAAGELRTALSLDPDFKPATVALQDVERRRGEAACRCTLRGHADAVYEVAYEPTSTRRLASASLDGTARVWDTASGTPVCVLVGHEDKVTGVTWSKGGEWLATASVDRTARVWHVRAQLPLASAATLRASAVLEGHKGRVTRALWTSDGEQICTSSTDKTARIWRVAVDGEGGGAKVTLLHRLEGHNGLIPCLSISPDDRFVATASADGKCRVWTINDGQMAFELNAVPTNPDPEKQKSGNGAAVNLCAFLPQKNLLATCQIHAEQDSATVFVWDVDGKICPGRHVDGTLSSWRTLPLRAGGRVLSLASSLDSENDVLLSVGGSAGDMTTFDLSTAAAAWACKGAHEVPRVPGQAANHAVAAVEALAYSKGGEFLASGGVDGAVRVWDAEDGRVVCAFGGCGDKSGAVKTIAWDGDTCLASGGVDGVVRVYSIV